MASFLRRYSGATTVQEGVVMPKIFLEASDQGLSFHMCPDDWTSEDIEKYVDAFPVPSGARLGVILVREQDFDLARIPRPVHSPTSEPFGELHYETPSLTDEEAGLLASVVSKNLPQAWLLHFRRKPI